MEVLCADKCKQLEEKIKIPMRYIMMALTVVLVLIIYLLTRKCGFFTYCAFFPSLFACMKSMHDNKGEEKKWCSFWMLFSLLQVLPRCLDRNIYYGLVKCVALLYFAFFDTCDILINGLNMAYEYIEKGLNYYKSMCAKVEKSD